MPNHPRSNVAMIGTGTGTGSAPMRALTNRRRRLRAGAKFDGGRRLLFFGARTQQELPCFGPLRNLLRERAADLGPLLVDPDAHYHVCGLRAIEEGVVLALAAIARDAGHDWDTVGAALRREGWLHLETY